MSTKSTSVKSTNKTTTTKESESTVTTKKAQAKATTKESESTVHPLQNFIPSSDWYKNDEGTPTYVSREIGGVTDIKVLDRALALGHNVLLAGPTGSAKTSLCYAFGAKHNLPVINVPCNGAAEPSLFIGQHYRKEDGSIDFQLGLVAQAVLHGGIILFDEVNFLKPNIGAYVHSLLDSRRALYIPEAEGTSAPTYIKAHKDCLILGAYNPEYQGTRPLNEAFKNRFAFQLEWGYDREVENALLESDALLELGWKLREASDAGNISTPVSTNLLIEFEELAVDDELGFDFALQNFLYHFHSDEQPAVKLVLVQYAPKIYEELFEEKYPSDGLFNPNV